MKNSKYRFSWLCHLVSCVYIWSCADNKLYMRVVSFGT